MAPPFLDAGWSRPRAIFASDGVRRLIELNSLADLELIFLQARSARLRHDGRCVWETELLDDRGRATRVFAKLNWGRHRLWPRMAELKSGQMFQPLPVREWHGLRRLEQLGLAVAERMAVLQTGWWSYRSAILVRAVPPPQSVADLMQSGEWWALPADDRDAMLEAMAGTLRRIHGAGLGWRGTCVRHFFPERQPDGTCRHWLIDCEGVHRGAGSKVVGRDVRKLVRSMRLVGADEGTVVRFEQFLGGTASRANVAGREAFAGEAIEQGATADVAVAQ